MKKDNKVLIGLGIGLVAGAFAGYFLGTEEGRAIQKKANKKMKKLDKNIRKNLQSGANTISEKINTLTESTKSWADNITENRKRKKFRPLLILPRM